MRSKSYFFLLLVLGLGVLSGFLYTVRPYKYGLDVKGGVQFIYQMDTSKLSPEQRSNMAHVRDEIQKILVNRIGGSFGVTEPEVVPKGEDQFLVELPGFTDIEQAKAIIGSSARIEFYDARNVVSKRANYRQYIPQDETAKDGNPIVSFVRKNDPTNRIIRFGDPEYADIIKGWGTPIISGDELQSAEAMPRGDSTIPVMNFSDKGSQSMEAWSRKYEDSGEYIAAVLDGKVLSIAPLADNTVLRDSAQIEGTFKPDYVKKLTDLLNAGSLPVDLHELTSTKVDPTIGAQALNKIVMAGIAAFVVISLFMLVYYAFPGLVAVIALSLYVLFTLTVLKLIGATFSLAAIAGIVLSVGMAVDANILVFERFKEEMKAGKTLAAAIELGFRRALPAIVDSNACTILTSIVLAELGTGPVKGFATTLIIGVAISLFTAVFVTRSLLMFLVGAGFANNPKLYAVNRNWFHKLESRADTDPIHVVDRPKPWFILSLVSILVCLPFVFIGGLKPNVEFQGGYEAQYRLAGKDLSTSQIESNLEKAGIKGGNIKLGGEGAQRFADISATAEGPLKGLPESDAIAKITQAAGFTNADLTGSSSVGPAIQAETIRNAILAVLISSALIIVYLAFRFGFGLGGFASGLRFGVSAVGALVHDVLFVLGVTAVVGYFEGWDISSLFITSMLTVIGFSVHDTIVIFDRIRENLHRPHKGEDFATLVNKSITQSFARSLNTSMTVIVTLMVLLVFGTTTPDLKLFCATMLAGIASGTYSSIYNASPILYLWDRAIGRKRGEEHTLVGASNVEIARNRVAATQAATEAAATTVGPSGRTYGQVRRRANSSVQRSHQEMDDL